MLSKVLKHEGNWQLQEGQERERERERETTFQSQFTALLSLSTWALTFSRLIG